MELIGPAALILSGLVIGLASGVGFCYLKLYRPLLEENQKLVRHIVTMRKQGFVPQFEIDQPREHDPAADVVEY